MYLDLLCNNDLSEFQPYSGSERGFNSAMLQVIAAIVIVIVAVNIYNTLDNFMETQVSLVH